MYRKHLFLFTLLLLAVFLGSCIEEPASPTWLTNNRLPLINTIYTVERLIEESRDPNLVISPTGTVDYLFIKRYDRLIDIQDSLRLSLSRTLNIQSPATVGTPVVRNDSLKIVGGKVERIDSVVLKRGIQRLTVENLNASSGTITVTFPTVRNSLNNQPLTLSTPFAGNSSVSIESQPLTNFRITSPDRINVPFSVTTTLTAGNTIDLRITASSDSFVARYVKGVIWNVETNRPAEYDIIVEPIDINAFNSIDTVSGDADPLLTFKLFNFFNIADTAKPIFRSVNTRRNDTLLIQEQGRNIVRFVPASPEGAAVTEPSVQVVLDKTNSNALPVVLRLPNTIFIDGTVLVNPQRLTGSAFDTSTVALDFEIKIPIRFSLDTLAASDSSDINEELNTDNFENFVLNLRAENEIPFNTEGKIFFLDANRQPLRLANGNLFTFPRTGDTTKLRFASAPINLNTGFSNGKTVSTIRLDFNPEEIRLLKRAKFLFNQLFINTKTPTTRRVILRSSDTFRLRGTGEITYRIGN
jgi:hypothetical protein